MKQLTPERNKEDRHTLLKIPTNAHRKYYGTTPAAKPYLRGKKKKLDRRPRPGKKNTHMGNRNPYRNESRRRKKRNGKSDRHQHHKMDKNKLPQRQTPHLRRTQSIPRSHLERQEKMVRIHSKKSPGHTPPPYHIVLPHYTSHLHKNH